MVWLELLGIIDIISGVVLAVSTSFNLAGSGIALWIGIFMLLKGVYSVLTAAGAGFYFDVLGWLDLIAAASLFIVFFGVANEFFVYFGILMILKGIYSFVMGFTSSS
jgi:uncharacterized membrane protein HdeD (DUF308 family)